jgi:hypothetical protein
MGTRCAVVFINNEGAWVGVSEYNSDMDPRSRGRHCIQELQNVDTVDEFNEAVNNLNQELGEGTFSGYGPNCNECPANKCEYKVKNDCVCEECDLEKCLHDNHCDDCQVIVPMEVSENGCITDPTDNTNTDYIYVRDVSTNDKFYYNFAGTEINVDCYDDDGDYIGGDDDDDCNGYCDQCTNFGCDDNTNPDKDEDED